MLKVLATVLFAISPVLIYCEAQALSHDRDKPVALRLAWGALDTLKTLAAVAFVLFVVGCFVAAIAGWAYFTKDWWTE